MSYGSVSKVFILQYFAVVKGKEAMGIKGGAMDPELSIKKMTHFLSNMTTVC